MAGEALYRAADIRWQVDALDVNTRPSARQHNPLLRAQIDEDWMREVIKKFPGTKWADLAAYHLIENKVCGDWGGETKCPEKESEIYEKYVHEHPQSPKAAEALYQAAWRQAALIQMYKDDGNAGRSSGAKNKAIALARQVASQYAQTDWGARAQELALPDRARHSDLREYHPITGPSGACGLESQHVTLARRAPCHHSGTNRTASGVEFGACGCG